VSSRSKSAGVGGSGGGPGAGAGVGAAGGVGRRIPQPASTSPVRTAISALDPKLSHTSWSFWFE
jgi:hypothetical protein